MESKNLQKPDFEKAAKEYCDSYQSLKDWVKGGKSRARYINDKRHYVNGANFGYNSRNSEVEELKAENEKLKISENSFREVFKVKLEKIDALCKQLDEKDEEIKALKASQGIKLKIDKTLPKIHLDDEV